MATHDTITRTKVGVTHATLVARIVRTFDRATPSDVESGARWYDDAGQLATELGAIVGDVDTAACLIAALSPRTSWARNVAGAVALANGHDAVACIGTNVDRARNVLTAGRTGGDAYAALGNGPKVARFARNIAGDRESVTVDVWAARVAGVTEAQLSLRGVYDALEAAYRAAARRRGVDPATMQATTWIVARGGRAA